jgi:2-oxoglutarate ferredoxin oxidoreductase subunit beta
MTGGQMAPTTLPGQVTTTSPYGRDVNHCGYPVKVSEMLAQLDGPALIARVSVHDVPHIMQAKKLIKQAFQNQIDGKGFSMIEVLSTCRPTGARRLMEALDWLVENMIPRFPLGVYKEV